MEMSEQAIAFALTDVEWEIAARINIELHVVSKLFANTMGH